MAIVDLAELQPTTISRDLKGKFVLLYGEAKSGKTSMSASFPKNLILATEVGYHGLPNAHVVDIDSWSTFRNYISQLSRDNIKELYHTITIDTVSILYELCEKYVCQKNTIAAIGDLPYGKGYAELDKEFADALRRITLMGYGIVFIAHSERGVRKNKFTGMDEEFVRPALSKRPYAIVNRLVDVIAYIHTAFNEDGESVRRVYTREQPNIFAGSRFRYLAPSFDFGYEAFANAIYEAVEMEGKMGATVVDDADRRGVEITRSFEEVMAETRAVWSQLIAKNQDNVGWMASVIEQVFGSPVQLSTVEPTQQQLLEVVLTEFKEKL